MNNTKRNNIFYWVATLWLSLGMVSTAVVQLLQVEAETNRMKQIGFPVYLLTGIGVAKLLGVIAVLIPKFPLLKEWAYAGFFFLMAGAVFAHIMSGDEMASLFGPMLLLVLTLVSWFFRPADRKYTISNY